MLVYLVQPFPTVRFLVYPLFALVWIVMAALYISLISQTVWDKAVDAYRKLFANSPGAQAGKSNHGKTTGSIQMDDDNESQNEDELGNNREEEIEDADESGNNLEEQ
jgi:hypothetical protein